MKQIMSAIFSFLIQNTNTAMTRPAIVEPVPSQAISSYKFSILLFFICIFIFISVACVRQKLLHMQLRGTARRDME